MATAVQELIRFAKQLEDGEAKLVQLAQIDQSIREGGVRLANHKETEAQAKLLADNAVSDMEKVVAAAEAKSAADVAAVKAKADAAIVKVREAAAADEARLTERVEDLTEKRDALKKEIDELEAKESRLGQKIAGLRADLAALRARLG